MNWRESVALITALGTILGTSVFLFYELNKLHEARVTELRDLYESRSDRMEQRFQLLLEYNRELDNRIHALEMSYPYGGAP